MECITVDMELEPRPSAANNGIPGLVGSQHMGIVSCACIISHAALGTVLERPLTASNDA